MTTYLSDITILGGLSVTIAWTYEGPDWSVGCPGGIAEWCIVAVTGRKVKKTDWLETRIMQTKGEEDRIIDALLNDKTHWDHAYD